MVSSEICLTGTLPELRDQDLWFWDVEPAEALITWRFTIEGIPTTITSLYLFELRSAPGEFPIDEVDLFRLDTDWESLTPPPVVMSGVSLPAARYLVAITRGDPVGDAVAPAGEYRVTIEREQSLPPAGDLEPNDDLATATPVSHPIALIGNAQGSPDFYRWTISEEEAAQRWQLDVRGVAGDQFSIELQAEDGSPLATTRQQPGGQVHLHDLQLDAGVYHIVFSGSGDEPLPYVLTSVVSDAAETDPEPNDTLAQAVPIAIGERLPGRLAGPRDVDHYAFSVPVTVAAAQTDIGLHVGSAVERKLCLARSPNEVIQCRQGRGSIVLSNLSLEAGDHVVSIEGEEDLDDRYEISVEDVGPIAADREIEPNDDPLTASPFDPSVVMRGRSANGDEDHFRITVTGEPGVWRLDATGTGIRSLLWIEPDLEVRGTADVASDAAAASLWDMYLVPGDHWIAIRSEGEDYTLTMTPLGPRAEGTEREPNDDTANAEALAIDRERVGRLPGPADTDVYRFSLQARELVTILLEPPPDAAIRMTLAAGRTEMARVRQPRVGEPIVYQGLLHAGDYELSLESDSGSTGSYRVVVERGDPFASVDDLEPNDTQLAARTVPPTLRVSGHGYGTDEDYDWYVLPPLEQDATVTFTPEGEVRLRELRDDGSAVRFDPIAEGAGWTSAEVPAGTVLIVNVTATGDYALAISSDGLTAADPPPAPHAEIELVAETQVVGAYALVGQRVGGSLRVANTGPDPLELALEATTSHFAWTVEVAEASLEIAAGEASEVPLSILVGKDAWADIPVRITVRAADVDGGQVATAVDITPRRDVPLVSPEPWWPVPDAMLGGLDAAALSMGASVPDTATADELKLHDGIAMSGVGFSARIGDDEPLELTVDLATDKPVPVAGIIIAPLAHTPTLATSPRHFELLLSDDAETWAPVLQGELTPLQQDQAFALDEPAPARFARLRIPSSYGGTSGSVVLGEWQVIAVPGWSPGPPFDIADPLLGGHVVWSDPGATQPEEHQAILSAEAGLRPWTPQVPGRLDISWAVGFHDGRAAQVTEMQWVDRPGSDPEARFDEVSVDVSTGSALGPWLPAGTWRLERAADGSVGPFRFETPTWARFLRFTGAGPETPMAWEMPVTLRILERPIDDEYRSILGAWGRNDPAGIHELLVPPDVSALELSLDLTDGNDSPATATPLPAETTLDGRVRRGQDVDWYELAVPEGQNTLEFRLRAGPEAGLVATLFDVTGSELELSSTAAGEAGTLAWTAEVDPGAVYHLRIEQPPFSTVISYDTSGSMGAYLSFVNAALRGFAADVTPGEETILVMPFEEPPLLEHWSDDAWEIESAVAGVAQVRGSSGAESSILAALRELMSRPGAKAILVVTDAETLSFQMGGEMWKLLDEVRPVIFSVHVAGGGAPILSTDLMQDWAQAWGGHYEYAASHGQIDRAFDRLATWLRRPAGYSVSRRTSFVSREPGSLSVTAPVGAEGAGAVIAGTGVAVEILLDTSGSMRERLEGRRRIDVAKDVLDRLINGTLPPGMPTALRIFKPGRRSCDSELLAPLAPLDRDAMSALVEGLRINRRTRTPLAATLEQVAADLAANDGPKIVVLVTDGQESCEGDPEQAIRGLIAEGLDVRVNIVGFDLDDEELKADIARWATLGNGQAFDARGADELEAGIRHALSAPFRVLDAEGEVVASGTVGGGPIRVPPGSYRLEVLADPLIVHESIEVPAGEEVIVALEPDEP
ncbi:hypothetical protein BH23CHL8_BH23CHL8_11730 [soil metagenome]